MGMKRILSFLMIATILFCNALMMCGCEDNSDRRGAVSKRDKDDEDMRRDDWADNDLHSNIFGDDNKSDAHKNDLNRTIVNSSNYSNERAWIEYEVDDVSYLASIDKKGNEIFKVNSDTIASYDDFEEEYTYLHMTNGDLMVLDKNGDVVYTVSETTDGTVLAYGGGYVLYTRHEEAFDYSRDVYEVFEPTGNVHQIDIGGKYGEANYCGSGVFGIALRGEWGWPVSFYDVKDQNWIISYYDDVSGSVRCKFDNGMVCFGLGYYDSRETGYDTAIRYIKADGTWGEKPLFMGLSFNDYGAGNHDGVVVLHEIYSDDIYCYDLKDGNYWQLEKTYASRALTRNAAPLNKFDSKETGFKNNRFVLEMEGDDSNFYVAMFDKQWNVILQPTTYDEVVGFDGFRLVLIINGQTLVYDENGEILFSATDIGVDYISAYSNGVAMVDVGVYIDASGNRLFDDISFLE